MDKVTQDLQSTYSRNKRRGMSSEGHAAIEKNRRDMSSEGHAAIEKDAMLCPQRVTLPLKKCHDMPPEGKRRDMSSEGDAALEKMP
jgi:hypothetical protein